MKEQSLPIGSPQSSMTRSAMSFTPPPLCRRSTDLCLMTQQPSDLSVLLTATSSKSSEIMIDPRPKMKPTPNTNFNDDIIFCREPLKYEAPVKSFMQEILRNLNTEDVTKDGLRLISIDLKLLELLKRISPKLLGGTSDLSNLYILEETIRANASNVPIEAPVSSKDLNCLYDIVINASNDLQTRNWKYPKNHNNFQRDGGWPIYILKVHQLILNCLEFDASSSEMIQNATFQSNIFETLSLWSAAVRASMKKEAAKQSKEDAYSENVYRDYHQSSLVQHSDELNSDDKLNTVELKESDMPNVDASTSPYTLTVILIDGASDFQQIGESSTSDFAYMPSLIQEGLRNEKGNIQSVVFVEYAESEKKALISLDCDMLSFAINCAGRYDSYLQSIFLELMIPIVSKIHWRLIIPHIFIPPADPINPANATSIPNSTRQMIMKRACHGLRVLRTCLKTEQWGETRCEYMSNMLLSSSVSAIDETLNDLVSEVWHSAFHRNNIAGLKRLEGLLVALLGHTTAAVRSKVAVLLNAFYDQHDWQMDVPLVPVIKEVGDRFEIAISLDDVANPAQNEKPRGIFVILSAPSFNPHSPSDVYSYHEINWKSTESVKGRIPGVGRQCTRTGGGRAAVGLRRYKWIGSLSFGKFTRCGFYDWRVVRINEQFGSWETVLATFNDIRRCSSSCYLLDLRISLTPEDRDVPSSVGDRGQMIVGKVYPHPQRMAELLRGMLNPGTSFTNDERQTFALQGRFIVQAQSMSDEQIHEIFVDQHGIEVDSATGRVNQRGTFNSVNASLAGLRESGITTVYLMGALARDNGEATMTNHGPLEYERPDASPFAVSCRATPNVMLGETVGMLNLLREAHRVGIKLLCDAQTRVSSSRPHRKYERYFLKHVDSSGKLATLYGSKGRAATYEDTCQLNYRHVETWDLMVADMAFLAGVVGVHGFRLENCQSWPPIMAANMKELTRTDADGVAHYSVMERLLASVVIPFSEEESGFWSTSAARSWCNPFLVKICKELWREFPELVLLGECFGAERGLDRHSILCKSGVVPQLQDMPSPLARLFGHAIDPEDSTVTACDPTTVREIVEWFDASHSDLPEGAIVVQSSCSHLSPLPGLLYGKGAWPAVDLLFLLPDVPSTFSGEIEGRCFRLDITNVFTASVCSTAPQRLVKLDFPASTRSLEKQSSAPHLLSAVRGLQSFEPLSALSKLEAEQTKSVGPEYGFDLKKIHAHYAHRRLLRHQLKIIRNGVLVPLGGLHAGTWHPRVLAFLRFDPEIGEFVLVAINFSEEVVTVEVSLRALGFQFRDMGMESGTMFMTADLLKARLSNNDNYYNNNLIQKLGQRRSLNDIFKVLPNHDEIYSMAELLHKPQNLKINPYSTVCLGFRPLNSTELSSELYADLYYSSLCRLESIVRGSMTHAVLHNEPVPCSMDKVMRFNFVMESLLTSTQESGLSRFASVLLDINAALQRRRSIKKNVPTLHDLVVDSGLFSSSASQKFDSEKWRMLCSREGGGAAVVLSSTDSQTALAERLLGKMKAITESPIPAQKSETNSKDIENVLKIVSDFIKSNDIGPIVLVTTELGKWSTVGGLGVMVDELSCTLAQHLGQEVYIVTPYYNFDRKGQPAHLDPNEIQYKANIKIEVAGEEIILGVHEGEVRNVNLIFLHNARFFPHPYPTWNVPDALRFLAVIGKSALEVLCQKRLIPQLVVTNDWTTGLVAAYAKNPFFFGEVFSSTTFFHIVHNLDSTYEGRIYADRGNKHGWITELNTELLVDPTWTQFLFNPSRCALLTSDAWGTVSPSYSEELRQPGGSALSPLLSRYPTPFAYPNGVPLGARLQRLAELKFKTHSEAKAELQRVYFGYETPDLSVPLFAFIGRITEQKGVHNILEATEQIIQRFNFRAQILIGGKVSWGDPYSAYCGRKMEYLRAKYPFCFWADPNEFFSNGPLVNLGADVGLMPSKFEPGGIVQHEFFIAGTPVLAFRTGGLRDTVYEFDWETMTGNGFTFEAYQLGDFLYAVERAHRVVTDSVRYERIRENARYSVISCEQVAQAWLMEFCRLRRKLPVNNSRVMHMCKSLKGHWDIETWTKNKIPSLIKENKIENKLLNKNPETKDEEILEEKQQLKKSLPKSSLARDIERLVPAKVIYTPKGIMKPRAVALSGSFDNWQIRRPMIWEHGVQSFILTIALKPGKYLYKLVIDGNWEINPNEETEIDLNGICNNVILIE